MQAEWKKLDDGTWGVMAQCGGRSAEMVGQMVVVKKKDRSATNVTLGPVVKDFGKGDWAVFEVAK
jgi:hypothetical protein